VNGNLTQVVEDAKKLTDAVFQVYPQVLSSYSSLIGPVSTPEQQKILFDLSVTCLAIANKESRVEKFREDRKNGNGNGHQLQKPRVISETPATPAKTGEQPEQKEGVSQAEQPKPAPNGPRPPEDEPTPLRTPRDERDRPTEQLIQELNIRTPKEAGYLRYKKQISFKEWQRVRDYVSQQEIQRAGGFTRP
jgi:hypothetical protein